ncbi:unnamed protein product [Caenorhabditis auriculariae]|uniref:glutathione transferase n=1 Tax=Caenorhabditis auriculariae TaxID=2777116 RepID=A0A8S1HQA0_9PELO|nr:unnamed protein product [Caenorhabditis auriculariae]
MPHYKLTYFPIRGAGEGSRQIFALAGQEFEDNRVPREQWLTLKPTAPFGQMPYLEFDGKKLAQSYAINRYLARQFGFAGKSAFEEALVDSLADHLKDHMSECRPYFVVFAGFGEGDVDKLRRETLAPAVTKNYAFFTKFLKENGSGFLVGSSVTWVDLLVAQHTADLLKNSPEVLDAFPEVKAHQQKIHSIPNIKKWLETRPETPF